MTHTAARTLDALESIMTRKPADWDEAASLPVSVLSENIRQSITNLPQIDVRGRGPMQDLTDGQPEWFLAIDGPSRYLVLTSGSRYARYVLNITEAA